LPACCPNGASPRTTLSIGEIADDTSLEPEHVVTELERLIEGGYVAGPLRKLMSGGDLRPWFIVSPRLTDKGTRAVRIWPGTDELLSALTERAESESDPERKSKLRALAAAARSVGVDVLGEVLAAAAKQAAGLP